MTQTIPTTLQDAKVQLTTQYATYDCIIDVGSYGHGGRLALQLIDANDGEPVATATVNIPEADLAEDEILVKDYSENFGMMDALEKAGIAERTGRFVPSGYVNATVARLLVR